MMHLLVPAAVHLFGAHPRVSLNVDANRVQVWEHVTITTACKTARIQGKNYISIFLVESI